MPLFRSMLIQVLILLFRQSLLASASHSSLTPHYAHAYFIEPFFKCSIPEGSGFRSHLTWNLVQFCFLPAETWKVSIGVEWGDGSFGQYRVEAIAGVEICIPELPKPYVGLSESIAKVVIDEDKEVFRARLSTKGNGCVSSSLAIPERPVELDDEYSSNEYTTDMKGATESEQMTQIYQDVNILQQTPIPTEVSIETEPDTPGAEAPSKPNTHVEILHQAPAQIEMYSETGPDAPGGEAPSKSDIDVEPGSKAKEGQENESSSTSANGKSFTVRGRMKSAKRIYIYVAVCFAALLFGVLMVVSLASKRARYQERVRQSYTQNDFSSIGWGT